MSAGGNARTIFDAVLDTLVEPVMVTDADGVITYINATAVQRLGADKDVGHRIGHQLARLAARTSDGGELPPSLHPISRALAHRQAVIGAEIVYGSGAESTMFVVNTVPLSTGDHLLGTVSVFHDITVAERLERDVADHAARLEAVVNLVHDGVYIVAADGTLLFANAVGRRILDVSPGTTLAERLRRLEPEGCDGRRLAIEDLPSARALRGESVTDAECLVANATGERRRLRSNADPLRRPDGSIYAALVISKDVTDETRALEELRAARGAAEEANRLKDQFIAALSHELRTPLQPILGWTEVLRRHGKLDDVTTRALEAIHRNIRQQVRLVDDLLDLSRIVHGKFALRFESFDIRDHVRAAVDAFEEGASLKRIRLSADIGTEALPIWGDGARLQQIVSNLLANALKFTPAGGRVWVRLARRGTRAVLEIDDTGEGISPDDLPVIFEAFRQGSQSPRRGGLGIGLDLVKRLTELHGGTVTVTSPGLGCGACFRVDLPLSPPGGQRNSVQAAARGRLGDRTVLIVEDNADTREVLKFMLEAEGARVDVAERGEDGVRVAGERLPQIVLCDIGLPDIDGMEVARRIRAMPDLGGVRLIALTGYGQTEDIHQAVEAGFETHLTKPINLDQLLALMMSPGPAAASGLRPLAAPARDATTR